ncbi:MAG: transcriptional regulator [Firmicutes bacterium]|nr:transcriptional regulator [Bacillota bacterium]
MEEMSTPKISLKKKIYDEIFDGIVKGEFPMDQFINEGYLATKYGVSKAPIREALIELCNEKILRSIPRLGYQIVQLNLTHIKESIEVRFILEIAAFKKTAQNFNDSYLVKLSEMNKENARQKSMGLLAPEQHWERNCAFHLLLCSFSGNTMLTKMLADTLKLMRRAFFQLYTITEYQAYVAEDPNRHMEIEDALRKKNFEAVADLLEKDILHMRRHAL